MVTDYDCWHTEHDAVTVDQVVRVMQANAANAAALVRAVLPGLGARRGACAFGCDHALDHALITAPAHRDAALMKTLGAVAGRVLRAEQG